MEERSPEILFLGPNPSQQEIEELTQIGREYINEMREIAIGRLNLAIIDKNNALHGNNPIALNNAQQEYEQINTLSSELSVTPYKFFPYIFKLALAYRNLDPQLKGLVKIQVPIIKQTFFKSNVSDENYSDKQAIFRFALGYESNEIFEKIAKQAYAYKTFNAIKEGLKVLHEKIVDQSRLSQDFYQKVETLYSKLQALQAVIVQEPLLITLALKKVQCLKSSMPYFETVMNLNDSEEEALAPISTLFDKLDTYKEELSHWLSRIS